MPTRDDKPTRQPRKDKGVLRGPGRYSANPSTGTDAVDGPRRGPGRPRKVPLAPPEPVPEVKVGDLRRDEPPAAPAAPVTSANQDFARPSAPATGLATEYANALLQAGRTVQPSEIGAMAEELSRFRIDLAAVNRILTDVGIAERGVDGVYFLAKRIAPLRVKPPSDQEPSPAAPIPMVLHCPFCGLQHIDAPEPETGWTNPAHTSHLCHNPDCQRVWRPAAVPTTGVEWVTRGASDSELPPRRMRMHPEDQLASIDGILDEIPDLVATPRPDPQHRVRMLVQAYQDKRLDSIDIPILLEAVHRAPGLTFLGELGADVDTLVEAYRRAHVTAAAAELTTRRTLPGSESPATSPRPPLGHDTLLSLLTLLEIERKQHGPLDELGAAMYATARTAVGDLCGG